MGRFVLVVLVVLGIGYGVWAVVRPEEPAPALATGDRSTPAGESAQPNEKPGALRGAPDPDREAAIRALTGAAAGALERAEAAPSRRKSIEAKDEARRLLSKALMKARGEKVEELKRRVTELNDQVLFSEEGLPGKSFLYTFQANDRLWTLCNKAFPRDRRVKIEPGFLLFVNGLADARRIREGHILVVPSEELSLVVSKSEFHLRVLLGGVFLKEYRVGIGEKDKTPEGEFEIETKTENPAWYSPAGRRIAFGDPENPLGSRWMGFKRTRRSSGYGIHGTDDPKTVGAAVSQGCIRMLKRDVEELFTWVPRGTKVRIVR